MFFCLCFSRMRLFARTMHRMECANLGHRANLIIQWGHWATALLRLLLLICPLLLTLLDLQWVLWLHHLHPRTWGLNWCPDLARMHSLDECLQWAVQVVLLVHYFQRAELFLVQVLSSLDKDPLLQAAAVVQLMEVRFARLAELRHSNLCVHNSPGLSDIFLVNIIS